MTARQPSLADRIRAHAALTTRPGQLRELEDIANAVELLHDEARAAYNVALYFARALKEHHDTHHHPDGTGCDPEKWATCRAVEWMREMGHTKTGDHHA